MDQPYQDTLVALEADLRVNLSLTGIYLEKVEGHGCGFLTRVEREEVEHCPGATDRGRVGKLIQILRKKENSAFWKFCTILEDSGNELWAKKLKETVEERLALPSTPSDPESLLVFEPNVDGLTRHLRFLNGRVFECICQLPEPRLKGLKAFCEEYLGRLQSSDPYVPTFFKLPDDRQKMWNTIREFWTFLDVQFLDEIIAYLNQKNLITCLREHHSLISKYSTTTLEDCREKKIKLPRKSCLLKMSFKSNQKVYSLKKILQSKDYLRQLGVDRSLFEGFTVSSVVLYFSISPSSANHLLSIVPDHIFALQSYGMSHIGVHGHWDIDVGSGRIEYFRAPQVHHPKDSTEEGAVSDLECVELLQLRDEVVNLRLNLKEKDANLKTLQEEYHKAVSAYLTLQREMKDDSRKEPSKKIAEIEIHYSAGSEGQGSFDQKPSLTEQTMKDEMELKKSTEALKIVTLSNEVDILKEALQEEKNIVNILLEKVADLVEQKDSLTRELFALSLTSTAQTVKENVPAPNVEGNIHRPPVGDVPAADQRNEEDLEDPNVSGNESIPLLSSDRHQKSYWAVEERSRPLPIPGEQPPDSVTAEITDSQTMKKMAEIDLESKPSSSAHSKDSGRVYLPPDRYYDVKLSPAKKKIIIYTGSEFTSERKKKNATECVILLPESIDKIVPVTLRNLLEFTAQMAAGWEYIGIGLGLADKVDELRSISEPSRSKITILLQTWLRSGSKVSWTHLVNVLESPAIGMGAVAANIKDFLYKQVPEIPDNIDLFVPMTFWNLVHLVVPFAQHWEKIGRLLKLQEKVKELKKTSFNDSMKMTMILDNWAVHGDELSWLYLLEELEDDEELLPLVADIRKYLIEKIKELHVRSPGPVATI